MIVECPPASLSERKATCRAGSNIGDSEEEDPQRSPANVAVPLVYIASEQSDWLNGQIVGASGYELQLFNKPAVIRQVRGTERWTTEGAAQQIEELFKPAVGGGGFYG